jgi:hypothetical protein
MALQSSLFRGDPKLEAAAVSDAAHIVPGAKGEHVRKIQLALNQLDKAGLDPDSIYGNATAAAVLAYKRKRSIINKAYQSQADNIVGKMTIASLDQELLQQRPLGPLEFKVRGGQPVNRILPLSPFIVRQSLVSPRESFAVTGPRVAAPNPQTITTTSRWPPNSAGMITCLNTGSTGTAICTNHGDITQLVPKPPSKKVVFLSDFSLGPSNQAQVLAPEDGGRVSLTKDPMDMRLEAFRPGNATIVASRPGVTKIHSVEVRQNRKAAVPGGPLTKLAANSKFFSASREEGGEFDPHNVFTGRPVGPKRGGRLINLAGDGETPEFEDYQVDLDHSFDPVGGFRPWADDPDPSTFIPDKSASHITMRGTPLLDTFIRVIKRIARPGCRFTYNGQLEFLAAIRSQLPGRDLEPPIIEKGNGTKQDPDFVLVARELS